MFDKVKAAHVGGFCFSAILVCMTWAMRRRLIIIGILAAVLAGVLATLYFTLIRQAPSCFDNKLNQNEEGIDCGGSCPYYCEISQAAPSVRFVRPVSSVSGRTDVIAYIDNPNPTAAAKSLHYTIELYSPTNSVVAKKEGWVDLPPAATVPVFMPDFFSGSAEVARAFLTFDTPQHLWLRTNYSPALPRIKDSKLEESEMPRITALAMNPTAVPMKDISFIVTVFDGAGNAMGASRTVVPSIPAQGDARIIFTWPAPFPSTVARIEILPVAVL